MSDRNDKSDQSDQSDQSDPHDQSDFGYLSAAVGLAVAALLIVTMFATSGQV